MCLRHKEFRWSKIGVIYRDTKAQALSHANHFLHKKLHINEYVDFLKHQLPRYYAALDALLDDGAQLIDYHRFSDQGYIEQLARDFGIHDLQVNRNMMRHKVNSHPQTYSSFEQLPPAVVDAAHKNSWFDLKYGPTSR